MDGDSRGGAALSVKAVSGKPIKFVGAGEKLEALEPFYPDRLTSRILGEPVLAFSAFAVLSLQCCPCSTVLAVLSLQYCPCSTVLAAEY